MTDGEGADADEASSPDDFIGTRDAASPTDEAARVVVNIMFDRVIEDADVENLIEAGFEVHEKFDAFPIISGGIAASRVADLSSIAGVASVEVDREVGPA